jgi:hypothetical protein
MTEKHSLSEKIEFKKSKNFSLWTQVKNSLTNDRGVPLILRKYFISKAKQKYHELKKQANKEGVFLKDIVKKVYILITPACRRENKSNA